MTDTPEGLPSPDEFRRKLAHVDREFADARRYLSALCAKDNQALGALMAEIHRSELRPGKWCTGLRPAGVS
jgi:hypothetical protein